MYKFSNFTPFSPNIKDITAVDFPEFDGPQTKQRNEFGNSSLGFGFLLVRLVKAGKIGI